MSPTPALAHRPRTWASGLRAIMALAIVLVAASPAATQERIERRTLFQMLFGTRAPADGNDFPPPPPRRIEKPAPKVRSRKPQQATAPAEPRKQDAVRPATASAAAPPPAVKLEDAKTILVVGDFLASGLAEGLQTAFEQAPGVVVEARTNISSGLVRDDFYDWPGELPAMIDQIKPAMVVVLLGANDRQQMKIGSGREKFRSDAWLIEYEARVRGFAKLARERNVPLLWVGLPAFQSPAMMADAVQLNGIYRKQAESTGGEFIDIWDGFVDENGRFIVTGSDVTGQQVRLRGQDGMNFTAAGRRKIAFYVEKPARRLLGDMASPELKRLDANDLPVSTEIVPPEEFKALTRTAPMSLTDPDLDGATDLLGAVNTSVSDGTSPRDLLIAKGSTGTAPTGRVDDYRLAGSVTKAEPNPSPVVPQAVPAAPAVAPAAPAVAPVAPAAVTPAPAASAPRRP